MKYFIGSIIIAILGLILALYLGGLSALYIVVLLSILEISLSFDNAVMNAKILETMEPKWQSRFITFGIPIAVFGMRFLFPIVVVAIASGIGIYDTYTIAVNNPDKYYKILSSVHNLIYAFGGAFLLMVFLDFLFDNEREVKWIKSIESCKLVNTLSKTTNIELIIAIILGLTLTYTSKNYSIAIAYFSGILLHSIISLIDNSLNTNGIRNGIMGLLYLEVLDASFSFDGVIGAFALSDNIFIIMIGLGIGAMFVRSITLYLVAKKSLSNYQYLEHGAHYAILALSLIMFIKIFTEVNEIIIGTIGVGFIAIALLHSILENQKSPAKAFGKPK